MRELDPLHLHSRKHQTSMLERPLFGNSAIPKNVSEEVEDGPAPSTGNRAGVPNGVGPRWSWAFRSP